MKKPRVINKHHSIYGSREHPSQEWITFLYKGEHNLLSRMIWGSRNSVSKGFITNLKYFILRNEDRAIDLEKK
jgi:hypothetical protein